MDCHSFDTISSIFTSKIKHFVYKIKVYITEGKILVVFEIKWLFWAKNINDAEE